MDEIHKFLLVLGLITIVGRHDAAVNINWRPPQEAVSPSMLATNSADKPSDENLKSSEKDATIFQSVVGEAQVKKEAFKNSKTENIISSSSTTTKEPVVIWINAEWNSNQKNETSAEGTGLSSFSSLTNMSLKPEDGDLISEIPIEVQNETYGNGAPIPTNDTIVISLIPGWITGLQNITANVEKHNDGGTCSDHGDPTDLDPKIEKSISASKIAAEQDEPVDEVTLNSQMGGVKDVKDTLFQKLLPKPAKTFPKDLLSDSFKTMVLPAHEARATSKNNINNNLSSESGDNISSEEVIMPGEDENVQPGQRDENEIIGTEIDEYDEEDEECPGRASPPIEMMMALGIIPGFPKPSPCRD